jgi:hypothetical protein
VLVSGSKKGDTSLGGYYVTKTIPTNTHFVEVHMGANMAPSTPIGNQTNECYIDHVEFYIFKELNGIQHSCFEKCPLMFDYFSLSFVDYTDTYNKKSKPVN